jgi:hypothetical protein
MNHHDMTIEMGVLRGHGIMRVLHEHSHYFHPFG